MPKLEKTKNFYSFFRKIKAIDLKVVIGLFFLRQKSKRKGKGAVSPAPLSFISSLTKAHIKIRKSEMRKKDMRKKVRSQKLEIGKRMPPLYHKLPNEVYDDEKSEVLKWIAQQPQLLEWTFVQLKSAGYVEYNSDTGVWSGIEDWELAND